MNQPPTAAPEPNRQPWRRLFAFLFDAALVSVPVRLLMFLYDPDLYLHFYSALYGLAPSLLILVTSLPLSAYSTSRWGTTAGKVLLGLRVEYYAEPPSTPNTSLLNARGHLRFTSAYRRAISSFTVGAAMQIGQIMPFSLFFTYRSLKYRGVTFWDIIYRTRVVSKPVNNYAVIVFSLLSAALIAINVWPFMETVFQETLAMYFEQLSSQ